MPYWIGLAVLLLIVAFIGQALAKEVIRMSQEELKGLMGKPDVIIIDVRAKGDWEGSKEKIQGAVREDPSKSTNSWASRYPKDKTLVFYCA
jgi:rhodanese-related sulfurtransferase